MSKSKIKIVEANENNLKKINLEIPLHKITAFIGVSGSGKSSLLYNVIATEAYRREKIVKGLATCRDYAIRPKFTKIENLPHAVVVKQRGLQQSRSSTLATITGLHELLRDEFVKQGKIICQCGAEVSSPSQDTIFKFLSSYSGAPIELFAIFAEEKYDDCQKEIELLKKYDIEEVLIISSYDEKEKIKKVKTLKKLSGNYANTIKIPLGKFLDVSDIRKVLDASQCIALESFQAYINENSYHFKYDYICPSCNRLHHPATSSLLSFNTTAQTKTPGICTACHGCGTIESLDYAALVIPDRKINDNFLNLQHNGLCYKHTYLCADSLEKFYKENKIDKNSTFYALLDDQQNKLKAYIEEKLFTKEHITVTKFINTIPCPSCNGNRLNYKANAVKLYGHSISEILTQTIDELLLFFSNKKLHHQKIFNILHSLQNATVGYLSLDRTTPTLSGGELQRIKVAIQFNTSYKNLLYILDEPSIGLHAYDNLKFVSLLKSLRDKGNTVVISEHNPQYIKNSDYLIELGPGGGVYGGDVVSAQSAETYTQDDIDIKREKRQVNLENAIHLKGVCCNNINAQDFSIPLNALVVISGVSGSGKSSLVHQVLCPIIKNYLADRSVNTSHIKSVTGLEKLKSIVELDQSQIGLNSRSIILTYIGCFDSVRNIFASTQQSIALNLSDSFFSFNSNDGQCDFCNGLGEFENNICPSCLGKRYKPLVLEVLYKKFSISDVLDLTIDEAISFFSDDEDLLFAFNALANLGLGHLTLGRTTPTLSGGEGQRLKLAKSLLEAKNKIQKGSFIYILDEPTAGLSCKDIRKLFSVFDEILKFNNTIIVIEHNLSMIQYSDYVIDIGLGAGKLGGKNVFSGLYEDLLNHPQSLTAKVLRNDAYAEHQTLTNDKEREELIEKEYLPSPPQFGTLANCQKIYLTDAAFEIEKSLLHNYSLKLDSDKFKFFDSKEALLSFVTDLDKPAFYAFNPFTSDFYVYKKIPLSDIRNKLLKLSQIGFDELLIGNEIFYIKKDIKKIIEINPWNIRLKTDSLETAYLHGSGWLSVFINSDFLEICTRLVSVQNKIIGSPKITTSTFNRYLNPCRECHGGGTLLTLDKNLVIKNPSLSILDDGFLHKAISDKLKSIMQLEIKPAIRKFIEEDLFDFSKPYERFTTEELNIFLHGFIHKKFLKPNGNKNTKADYIAWKGLFFYVRDNLSKVDKNFSKEINVTVTNTPCPFCSGTGFNKELDFFTVDDIPIMERLINS